MLPWLTIDPTTSAAVMAIRFQVLTSAGHGAVQYPAGNDDLARRQTLAKVPARNQRVRETVTVPPTAAMVPVFRDVDAA